MTAEGPGWWVVTGEAIWRYPAPDPGSFASEISFLCKGTDFQGDSGVWVSLRYAKEDFGGGVL